jgi:EAL domain-containing protein (putative c-di-GMP-specific phosphodiesterase class I)
MLGRLVRRVAAMGGAQAKASLEAPAISMPVASEASEAEGGPGTAGVALEAAEAMARERLRAFAFAAADMLVETTPSGAITFASGRFGAFGVPARAMIGRSISSLVAPGDQAAFAMALSLVPVRGRLAPMVLHLSDEARSAAMVAARMVSGPEARLCFVIGPVPHPAPERDDAAPAIQSPGDFAREAEALMRAGGTGPLGLVEVQGWQAVKNHLSAPEQQRLRQGLGTLMGECAPGARGSELAEGRFGVLGLPHNGMEGLVRRVEQFLQRSAARNIVKVNGTEMSLECNGVAQATAHRVLRYAVSRFTAEGTAGVTAVGAAGGLSGILAQAEMRAQAVRSALAGHRFRLAFQPVVSLKTRAVHHYEALLRPIPTPGMPVGSVQEFVTFAEAVGLAEVMDLAVMEQALMALRAAPGISVAVNMSGLSVQSPDFCARLFALLEEMRAVLGPAEQGRLLVELTETAEIDDLAAATAALARLRALGVGLCLDDFGAGAAAFRYLQQFRVDYVKIDGSFVQAAQQGGRERAMVASMVELATNAGAQTVAEMIETEEQAALMRELGVDQGQGWLFGRPGGLPGAKR